MNTQTITVNTVKPPVPARANNSGTAASTNTPPQPFNPQLPDVYAKLGVVSGYSPKPPSELRFFTIGPAGDGKTSFWAGCPNTLIIDFEDGAWGVPFCRAHRIVCRDYELLKRLIAQLTEDAKSGRRPFQRVVFDTVDQMVELVNPAVAKEYNLTDITDYGSKGAGWSILRAACWDFISRLETAGYSWTCVGHITEKNITVNGKEKTVIRPVLFDSFAKQIARSCDYIASIYSETALVPIYREVNGRQIECGAREQSQYVMEATAVGSLFGSSQTKQRGVPNLNSKILLPSLMSKQYGWDAFCEAYNQAVAAIKQQQNAPQTSNTTTTLNERNSL